jgi:hypothetical protein
MIVLIATADAPLPKISTRGSATVNVKLCKVTSDERTYIGRNIIGIAKLEETDTVELHHIIERRICSRLDINN